MRSGLCWVVGGGGVRGRGVLHFGLCFVLSLHKMQAGGVESVCIAFQKAVIEGMYFLLLSLIVVVVAVVVDVSVATFHSQ